ncbi:MAG TPA: phosphatidate cytidylyltransferase [Usitatibacter sp.]|nr:phosphatidate cytidylyltransferase [Usitatibacter sp.]
MLATRVVTAVAALAVLLAMVFLAPPALWSLFMLAVALVGLWEWSRLCGLGRGARATFLALSGAAGAASWLLYVLGPRAPFEALALAAFGIATVFWVAVAPLWLARHLRPASPLAAAAGWIVIWPTWVAFVVLRERGPWILLAAAALVWVADIAAYFAGRRFGRRKLAPQVSPGKTWEGLAAALAAVAAYGIALAAIARFQARPFTDVFDAWGGVPAVAAMVALAALSVVGDLFESWMKRGAGVKDSSSLLPGHGGVLDRVDALTSTLPVAALALAVRAMRP